MEIHFKKILIISDNSYLIEKFFEICHKINVPIKIFEVASSFEKLDPNPALKKIKFFSVNVKKDIDFIINNYDLIISIHCKQVFPKLLVKNIKCINIHPGLNPYNRGWYPQVFSIINNLPFGATIHEIDELIDHGPIIAKKHVDLDPWDTSLSAYEKVLKAEIQLIEENIVDIISNKYKTMAVKEGNINFKSDFEKLCFLDLNEKMTLKDAINRLRALSHDNFNNAYFIDEETKTKVYLKLKLKAQNNE